MRSSVFIAIDGRTGTGTTSLTKRLAELLGRQGSVAIISLQDLYPGWDCLAEGIQRCAATVLAPLRQGRSAKWRIWDWDVGEFGQERITPPADFVIVEGVGAGTAPLRVHCEAVVWIDAPGAPAYDRAGLKDSSAAAHLKRWAAQEDALYLSDDVSLAATIVVSPREDLNPASAAGYVFEALLEFPAFQKVLGSAHFAIDGDAILVRHHSATPDAEHVFSQPFGSSSNAVWLDASDANTTGAGPRSVSGNFKLTGDGKSD